jgi:chromate reductase
MTRLLLIPGSTREDSLHTAALRTTAKLVPPGVTATLYDGLRVLPPFVPGEPAPGSVELLRQVAGGADAVLFSTPEFAGSVPGSFKNLLDWLVDGGNLENKPVAWLSVAAQGQDDGARATLETVLGYAGARLLRPACIRLPISPSAVDARGIIGDPQLHMALRDMVHALTRALTAPQPRPQPSWQAYSSVYPVIPRRDVPSYQTWRPGS